MGTYMNGRWVPDFPGDTPNGPVSGNTNELPPPASIPLDPPGPPEPTSGGYGGLGGYGSPASPYGGSGGTFNVGYGGTQGGVGTVVGGGSYQPQFPWGGFNQANQQSQQAAEAGLSELQQYGSQGPYGQNLMSIFNSPYGMPPELLAQQRRMLAETEAGSRANALRNSRQSANAAGFGNSLGAIRAQDMIRTESAANLNNAQAQLGIQDSLLGMQRQMGAGGLYNSLYGTDAGLRQSYAQGQLSRQFPIAPQQYGNPAGGGVPGGSPYSGGGWYNQGGKYQTQPQPYDPFVPNNPNAGNVGTSGGWTPQNPRSMW